MIAKKVSRRLMLCATLMMALFGMASAGCSPRTRTVVVTPPEMLLTPCTEAETSKDMLDALRAGDTRRAGVEYAGYVLRVRESHELCAGKIEAIRSFYDGLSEALDDDR